MLVCDCSDHRSTQATFKKPSETNGGGESQCGLPLMLWKHVRNIGSPGRIGEHHVLKIVDSEAGAYRQGEDIDDFIGVGADKVGAEDLLPLPAENDLVGRAGLAEMTRTVPVGRLLETHDDLSLLLPRLLFRQSDGGNRRDGEGNRRDGRRIEFPAVSVEQIVSGDPGLPGGHGRQRRPAACSTVAGTVDVGVGDGLEPGIDKDAFLPVPDPSLFQINIIDCRDTPGSVDHTPGIERPGSLLHLDVNLQSFSPLLDTDDFCVRLDVDTGTMRGPDEKVDQIGIEPRQGTGRVVQDADLHPEPGGKVGELERDVAPADKDEG